MTPPPRTSQATLASIAALQAVLLPFGASCAPLQDVSSDKDASQAHPGYELVWQEEFNTDGPPDPVNWVFGEEGFIRNNEHQWYQRDNAIVRNGQLIIQARQEKRPNPNFVAGSDSWKTNRPYIEYTSSLISTRGKHAWKFGRFEIRAKIDARDGLWPAIWTLGSARAWPGCGEIDIMEYYRDTIMANAAWAREGNSPWAAHWDAVPTPLSQLDRTEDWGDRFHIWRMDWDHDYIRIYLDDRLLNEVDLSTTYNDTGDRSNPFREPHYLLLNLALGGDKADNPAETDTQFPAHFMVDYVRIYQPIDQDTD